MTVVVKVMKVRKEEQIRNRYNQVPNMTQDTIWESDKNTRKKMHSREPRGQHFTHQVTIMLQRTDKKV